METVIESKGELRILDASGDTKVIWDHSRTDEIEAARKMFKDLKAKGYSAFSVNPDGSKNTLITEFDSALEKIIMIPRIVGG